MVDCGNPEFVMHPKLRPLNDSFQNFSGIAIKVLCNSSTPSAYTFKRNMQTLKRMHQSLVIDLKYPPLCLHLISSFVNLYGLVYK